MVMRFNPNSPPREFKVGAHPVSIYDFGNIYLDQNEQVTFKRQSGAEYDITAKDWGFYATPSINGRLLEFGFRTVLVTSSLTNKRYILIVEIGHENSFNSYLQLESLVIESWLDEAPELIQD